MTFYELQIWKKEDVGVADEGEHVCYTTSQAWANVIRSKLQLDLPKGFIVRKRRVVVTATLVFDKSGAWQ